MYSCPLARDPTYKSTVHNQNKNKSPKSETNIEWSKSRLYIYIYICHSINLYIYLVELWSRFAARSAPFLVAQQGLHRHQRSVVIQLLFWMLLVDGVEFCRCCYCSHLFCCFMLFADVYFVVIVDLRCFACYIFMLCVFFSL